MDLHIRSNRFSRRMMSTDIFGAKKVWKFYLYKERERIEFFEKWALWTQLFCLDFKEVWILSKKTTLIDTL